METPLSAHSTDAPEVYSLALVLVSINISRKDRFWRNIHEALCSVLERSKCHTLCHIIQATTHGVS